MYPREELNVLSQRKRDLRHKIRGSREALTVEMAHVLRPVKWADWAWVKWREIMPAVKGMVAPVNQGAPSTPPPQTHELVAGLFRWAPQALNFLRSMR